MRPESNKLFYAESGAESVLLNKSLPRVSELPAVENRQSCPGQDWFSGMGWYGFDRGDAVSRRRAGMQIRLKQRDCIGPGSVETGELNACGAEGFRFIRIRRGWTTAGDWGTCPHLGRRSRKGRRIMLPAIYIGGVEISMFLVMELLGMFLTVVMVAAQRDLYGLSVGKAILAVVTFIGLGFVGCRLFAVIDNSTLYTGENVYHMSQDYFGAIFLIPVFALLLSRFFSLTVRATLNICAKALALIRAFVRIGCFCAGCCGGKSVTVLGMTFNIPTRIMSSACCLLILFFLMYQEKKDGEEADLYPLFLVTYCLLNFIEAFMLLYEPILFGLTIFQIWSIIGFAAGLVFLLRDHRKAGLAGRGRSPEEREAVQDTGIGRGAEASHN